MVRSASNDDVIEVNNHICTLIYPFFLTGKRVSGLISPHPPPPPPFSHPLMEPPMRTVPPSNQANFSHLSLSPKLMMRDER